MDINYYYSRRKWRNRTSSSYFQNTDATITTHSRNFVGIGGFEPPQTPSKDVMLPLHHIPKLAKWSDSN